MGWTLLSQHDEGTDPTTQWDIGDATLHLTARGFDTLAATLGSDPATGATGYLLKDHLGSTRGLYSATKSPLAHLEYTPYGELYTNLGITTQANITPTFTGKPYDHETRLYYFPYRYYNPQTTRWIARDPLGMIDGPNMYAYVKGNVINQYDRMGANASWVDPYHDPYRKHFRNRKCCKRWGELYWKENGYSSLLDCINDKMDEVTGGWGNIISAGGEQPVLY